MLMRDMNFKKLSIVEAIASVLGSITGLLFALNGFGVWSLVISVVSTVFCRAALLNANLTYVFFPHFPHFSSMRSIYSFGGYMTINRLLWFIFTQADIFIIGKLLGKQILGIYSVASEIAALPMDKISSVLNQVAFPAFSRIQNDLALVRSHFLKAIRLLSLMSFAMLWGISSIAPEAVAVLFGEKWLDASLSLQVLSLVIPLRMLNGVLTQVLNGLGKAEISMKNAMCAAIVMPFSILVGIHWGISGVLLAWVIAYPLVFLNNVHRSVAILGLKMKDVLSCMREPVLCSSIMYVGVYFFKMILMSSMPLFMLFLILIVNGMLIFVLSIYFISPNLFKEVVNLFRRRIYNPEIVSIK